MNLIEQFTTWLREAAFGTMSFDDIRSLVSDAVADALKAERQAAGDTSDCDPYVYVVDVYPGFAIYQNDGAYYRRSYSVVDGKVTLGDTATRVEKTWVDTAAEALTAALKPGRIVPESVEMPADGLRLTETLTLTEAETAEEGGAPVVRGITIIAAGQSKNRRNYPAPVLRRDGPSVFEAAPVFVTNHDATQKTVRELAGTIQAVYFDESSGRLKGDLRGLSSDPALLAKAVEASRLLGAGAVGLSIDTAGRIAKTKGDTRGVAEIEELIRIPQTSVDIVMNPAAGGRLTESVAETSAQENSVLEQLKKLTEGVLKTMSGESVRWLIDGLSPEQIREANPTLGEAILARSRETVTENTETVKVEEAAKPATETLTEAQISERLDKMVTERMQRLESANLLAAKLTEAKDLPEKAREMVRERFSGQVINEADLDKMIVSMRDISGRANPNRVNVPGGSVSVTESYDINKARLEASVLARIEGHRGRGIWFNREVEVGGKKVTPFRKISEAVLAFHPELRERFVDSPDEAAQECLPHFQWGGGPVRRVAEADRLTEDISATTFNSAWADVLHRVLQKVVTDPDLNTWRQWISDIVPFTDLTNSFKFVRVGELGVMPTVAENGTYQEASPEMTNDQQAMTIAKKGYLFTLSWEAILRDDINVLARIPATLGRAWLWTVHDVIYGQLQLNSGAGQTMDSDSLALYHATHNNIATSAFSDSALETVRQKLPKQTDPDSGKRKAYRARYLLYQAPDLQRAIWESLQSGYKVPAAVTNAGEVNLPNFIRDYLHLEPVPVLQYPTTTTTRWEVVADQVDCDTAAVGFLGGRETPDIFVQDMETTGARFTADKITYKARGTVGCAIVNWRAFSRGNN